MSPAFDLNVSGSQRGVEILEISVQSNIVSSTFGRPTKDRAIHPPYTRLSSNVAAFISFQFCNFYHQLGQWRVLTQTPVKMRQTKTGTRHPGRGGESHMC
jgi:hypothetical protein